MPQAIVDPDELERFANELARFNRELSDRMRALNGQFQRTGDTWRDQEHQKFAQEFQQAMAVLARFIQTSNQHTPFLLAKARIAREYLTHRR